MSDFFPIILGSDENAYGSARLFHDAYGIKPLLMCERQLIPTCYSNLFDVELIENFGSEEVFAAALENRLKAISEKFEKIVVVPCSDYYACMLARIPHIVKKYVANRFISEKLVETLDTKDKFYALCEKHGLDYPKTVVCDYEHRLDLPEMLTFDYPIIVKPENSNAYDYLHCSFEGKKKVYFFNSAEEYLTMAKNMNTSEYKGKLIAQEFIPGGDDAMRVMNSYSAPDGKVLAMSLGQPVLEEYAPKTLGNYAAIISRSDAAIYEKIKKFLEDINYVGASNIDMKYDSRTGKYMMFEINPRLGRSSFFVYGTGLNMMKVMVDDCVYGKRSDTVFADKTALWYNVPKDVILKYVTDPTLSAEIRELFKKKKAFRTLDCKNDGHPMRRYRIWRYFCGQRKNFKKYFMNKNI